MPILQSRLLKLLEAGEHYRDKYHQLYNAIAHEAAQVINNRLDPKDALAHIVFHMKTMTQYSYDDRIIDEERVRYTLTVGRNVIERRRLMRKRGQLDPLAPQPITRVSQQATAAQRKTIREIEQDEDLGALPIPEPVKPPAEDLSKPDPTDLEYTEWKKRQEQK
jgi:hypothetical protein